MRLRLFSDIGHVMTKIDMEGICTSSRRKLKCACTLSVGTYDNVRKGKTCDRGTSRRYLLRTGNNLFILFCLQK